VYEYSLHWLTWYLHIFILLGLPANTWHSYCADRLTWYHLIFILLGQHDIYNMYILSAEMVLARISAEISRVANNRYLSISVGWYSQGKYTERCACLSSYLCFLDLFLTSTTSGDASALFTFVCLHNMALNRWLQWNFTDLWCLCCFMQLDCHYHQRYCSSLTTMIICWQVLLFLLMQSCSISVIFAFFALN
jgi:hypothetical protein